jgi:CheY-like chemotaxis protein
MLSGIAAHQLVLLDLRLPDLTGASVLETIRHYRDTRALPVVVLSVASVFPPLVRELAHAVVAIPFDLSALLTVVRDVVLPLGGMLSLEPTRSTAPYASA